MSISFGGFLQDLDENEEPLGPEVAFGDDVPDLVPRASFDASLIKKCQTDAKYADYVSRESTKLYDATKIVDKIDEDVLSDWVKRAEDTVKMMENSTVDQTSMKMLFDLCENIREKEGTFGVGARTMEDLKKRMKLEDEDERKSPEMPLVSYVEQPRTTSGLVRII